MAGPHALAPGARIGRYEILAVLGSGGMGEVYRARDPRVGREVAVKLIRADLGADAGRVRRFENEARAAGALNHPNIVVLHDVGEHDGTPYLVSELLHGQTLRERLRTGALSAPDAVAIAAQLAGGLGAAHEKGIIHRDLKPENVLVLPDGRVKILDFGVAKLQPEPATLGEADTALTGTGDVIGTVGYMAPEQVRGQPADARSDLFALGVLCHEMLAGRRPFVGASAPEIAAAIVRDDPSALPASVPPGLARVVRRCLEKDPARRYQSARDLAFALEVPRAEPRRTRIVWPVALGAIAVAAIATFFLTRSPRRTETDGSIAVLPFASLSPAADDAWFADGIHADLLTQLSKIGDLTVISRTSVLQYRNGARNIREIADSLGVAAILEGSVQRSGNHVRIEAHLIEARTDKEIWAERYDRELTDVLAIQSAVAEDIASALHAKLSVSERTRIERKPTDSTQAYDLYLRGLEYDLRPVKRPEILQTAERFYRAAIELDPSFALAHARLSILDAYFYWFAVDASVARLTDARTEADRALALQPDLPEAHRAAGQVHYVQRDYDAAIQQFQLDLASAPSDADALMNVGYVQRRTGRFDEAAATMRRALRLDPHSADAMFELSSTLIWLRDWPAADEVAAKLLSWAPDHTAAKVNRALIALAWKGDAAPAKDIIARYPSDFDPGGRLTLGDSIIFLLKEFPVEAAAVLAPLPYELIATRYEYYPKGLLQGLAAAVRGDDAFARTYYEAGRVLLEGGVREHPDDRRWHTGLGQAYALLGRKEDADREGRRAVELLPISRDAWDGTVFFENLAEIHARTGDVDAAVGELERLLSIPSHISPGLLRIEERWAALRSDPRFVKLTGNR